jgi:hypothetical protein
MAAYRAHSAEVVASLIVLTLIGAVALAISKGGGREQPDGRPHGTTAVNPRRLATFAVPGAVIVLVLLASADSNWDRYVVLAMTTILVVLVAAAVQLRKDDA